MFIMSAMALSLQRKITIIVLVLYWPALFIFAHIPIPKVVLDANVSDKSLHFLAYLILTFLIWFSIRGGKKVHWRKAAVWWIFLLVIGYGVVDELLQSIVAGRSCDVRDFFADVAGTLTGLTLFSIFAFWPAALIVAAIFIFGMTNVSRNNVADLLSVAGTVFYLMAYAVFTFLWFRSLEQYLPGLGSRRISIRWILLALSAPLVLLLTVKLASLAIGRTFILRDMIVSAAGIGVAVAAYVIAGRKIGRVGRSDIP